MEDKKKLIRQIDSREQLPALLTQLGLTGRGVELGVFLGEYSDEILAGSSLELLYSVDRWSGDRNHDHHEYFQSINLLHPYGTRSMVLRMDFDEAFDLFEDESLDFVYLDGYAHTGQDGGIHIRKWWSKVKVGGIFSGHDYHPQWKKTMLQVDKFMLANDLEMSTTDADQFPSWITIKEKSSPAYKVEKPSLWRRLAG